MSFKHEIIKRKILSQFGIYNFMRVGNFIPGPILEQYCAEQHPKEAPIFRATLEVLVTENSIQREVVPRPGYRLTLKGYELSLEKPSGLRGLFLRLVERFA